MVNEVMLIDDEPIDLFINERLLNAYGFSNKYVAFEDALAALRDLENRCRTGKDLPQVIFLDYFMPQIDGFDFLSRLKIIEEEFVAEFFNTHIIMLACMKSPEKRRKLDDFNRIFAVMNKPLSEKAVAELSKKLCTSDTEI